MTIRVLLLVLALFCFVLAAAKVSTRIDFVGAGLALFMVAELIG